MSARRRIANLVIGAVAVAAARLWSGQAATQPDARGTTPRPADRASAAAGGEPTIAERARTTRDLLADHLGASASDTTPHPHVDVCTIVVLVPDPIDSRLDWQFDAGIESVRRAFEVSDFVLERYWLPWTLDADSSLRKRDRTHEPLDLRRHYPGVLLFRYEGADARASGGWHAPRDTIVAIALLVPETPTAGIRQEVLTAALAQRAAAARGFGACPGAPAGRDELRVVGPTFSGTAESLRRGLGAWWRDSATRYVSVISGGATARSMRRLMTRDAGDRVRYSSTINPVNTLLGTLCHGVLERRLGIMAGEVALLTESNTSFGRAAVSESDTALHTPDDEQLEPPVACNDALVVPFPMSVSRLRAEYARHPATQQTGAPPPAARAAPRASLDLEDPASAFETPPSLADLTVPAVERVMDDIAQTLLAHRVRVAVVVATDVRDRLFVADELKRRLRDVRLVIVGSHVLLGRPEFNEELRGALVVSTYPLFVENQFWTAQRPSDRQRLLFSNELAEGNYNATVFQLAPLLNAIAPRRAQRDSAACGDARGLPLTDYRPPHATRGSERQTPVAAARRPPVWLTVIGRTTLAPVTMFPMSDATLDRSDSTHIEPGCAPVDVSGFEPSVTDTTILEFVVLYALGLGALVALGLGATAVVGPWRARRGGESTRNAAEHAGADPAGADPADAAARDVILHQRTAAAIRPVVAVCAAAPLLLLLLRARMHGWTRTSAVMAGLWLAFVATVVALVVSAYHEVARDRSERVPRGASRQALVHCGLIVLLAAIFSVATAVLLVRAVTLTHPAAELFFTRALQLGSGVSPVVPLVLGGAYLLIWVQEHLHRSTSLRTHFTFEAVAKSTARRIRNALFATVNGRVASALFAALVFFGAWLCLRIGRSMESVVLQSTGAFDLLHRGLLALLILLTVWTTYRFLAVWSGLHAELRMLDRQPYVEGFHRLPRAFAVLGRLTPVDRLSDHEATRMLAEALETRLDAMRRAAEQRWGDLFMTPKTSVWKRTFGDAEDGVIASRHTDALPHASRQSALALRDVLRGARPAPDAASEWEAAEEVMALLAVDYVGWVISNLRRLMLQALAAVVLTTMFLSSYPFEPDSLVRLIFFTLGGITVASMVVVLVRANRDPVLSRVANTAPGELTWDAPFIVNLLAVSAVPILTILASQFPEMRDFLFGWLTPVLKTVSHS